MTEPENTQSPPIKYASFNARMIASMIDIFIIMMIALPIADWLISKVSIHSDMTGFWAILDHPEIYLNPDKLLAELWRLTKEQHIVEYAVIENALQCIFITVYIIPLWFRYASTPGKMLLRMEIQDTVSGKRMSHKQAIIRLFGYAVSFIPFTVGFIWIAFNKKHQGWHDMIAGTVVVIRPKKRGVATETKSQHTDIK